MKKWKILNSSRFTVHGSQKLIQVLLENRGIKSKKEVEEFLNPKIESVTLTSVGINKKEVDKAIARIKLAIKNNEGIVVYGDYDVDGIAGTAILWEALYSLSKNVTPYIPHRVDEGYGLSDNGISSIQFQISNVKLIITVDNGIVANKAVEFAKKNNIDVIITDHHVKGSVLPSAHAIVHTTELCGTGVAYLLSKEIQDRIQNTEYGILNTHLELVALATVADLVPLNKHNRTLLKAGLEKLHKSKRLGLTALFEEAQIIQGEIDTYHIGHMIAPRLNASGRISHAMDSLRLICTTDKVRAKKLAQQLGQVNKERQKITMESSLDAVGKIRGKKGNVGKDLGVENLVFVSDKKYEQGVVGLIASRLVEEFYRPAIAVSLGEKISKGSARSVPGVNIIELIRSCSEFLTEAGGHPMAAGFSIETSKLEKFKAEIQKKAKKIDKKLFERTLKIDIELELGQVTIDLYKNIQKLAPFGMGNPHPVFLTKGVTVMGLRKVGRDEKHLKIVLQKDGITFNAILFAFEKSQGINTGDIIDIVYTVELNVWNNQEKLELKIKDIK